MKITKYINISLFILLYGTVITGCKKDKENYPPIPDAVYLIAKVSTGPYPGAITAIGNVANGKVSVSPATARVYVNTPKSFDVTVKYALSGTAIAGVNYTVPSDLSATIPAGQYFAEINIPVINTPLVKEKETIIISLTSASNNTVLGLGSEKSYKTFTYTLTN